MPQQLVILRVNCSGCKAEAWVNDIPIVRVDALGYPLDSRSVHEYLLPGENQFLLLVEPGANPSEPMRAGVPFQAGPRTFATLEVLEGPRGVFPDNPAVRKLESLQWLPHAGTQIQPPVKLQTSLMMSSGLPRWAWSRGESLKTSQGLTEAVLSLLERIAQAFGRGDPAPYMRAAEIKFQELARAYGIGDSQVRESFLSQWQRVSSRPGFRMVTPTRDTMALRLCGGGRLIDCLDIDFEPVLRAARESPDGVTPIRYPVKVAMFGREMHIVR